MATAEDMASVRQITALVCGSLLAAFLAPREASALTFYKYTFSGQNEFGFRVTPFPTGVGGDNVTGISLNGELFWDGPGNTGLSALTGSLTVQQYEGQTAVGDPITYTCPGIQFCSVSGSSGSIFSIGTDTTSIVTFEFVNPTTPAVYTQNDDPFVASSPPARALFNASQSNLSGNIQYSVDNADQLGGTGTITVQELPGPLSPLALSPLLLGLRSARKRYGSLNR